MKVFKISDLVIGILFTLLFISLSVVITINFRPLYYWDIELLNMEENTGYSKEEIKLNYDALIDYSSPFYKGKLSFPTLPASETGIIHFEEVKDIFTFFYILSAITLLLSILIIVYKHKKKDISYLLVASITSIVLPLLIAGFLAIDFDKAFIIFHKLFFNNDYWLFDPTTDPIINILPDTFFLHCALMIVFLVVASSAILLTIYLMKSKHKSIRYRKISGLKL